MCYWARAELAAVVRERGEMFRCGPLFFQLQQPVSGSARRQCAVAVRGGSARRQCAAAVR